MLTSSKAPQETCSNHGLVILEATETMCVHHLCIQLGTRFTGNLRTNTVPNISAASNTEATGPRLEVFHWVLHALNSLVKGLADATLERREYHNKLSLFQSLQSVNIKLSNRGS